MRILILASSAWNFFQRATPLCEQLAKHGIEVIFLEPMIYANATSFHLKPVTTIPIPVGVKVIRRQTKLRRGLLLALWQNFKNMIEIKHLKPDVVILYEPNFGILSALYTRLSKTKLVFDYIDDWPEWAEYRLEKMLLKYVIIPIVARLADVCTVTARLLGDDIKPYARQIYWIPNSASEVPPHLPQNYAEGEGVIFVGGLAPRIDVELIIETARLLPEVPFKILGNGAQYELLKNASQQLPNIYAPGTVNHNVAMEEIKKSAICLIPYKKNRLTDRCFPIKLAEYWSMGKVVVATPTAELQRAGKNGRLIFVNSAAECAEKIQGLLQDKSRLTELGRRGYLLVKRFLNYEIQTRRFLKIIESL